jgi:hypothetical protein
MPRILFRIVRGPTATIDDFRSNLNGCFPPRGPELNNAAIWAGLSTWDTRAVAEQTVRRFKGRFGTYIAELTVPDNDPRLLVQQTLKPSHYTMLGCETACLSCSTLVTPA